MKTVFDPGPRQELAARVALLSADSKARWGKMNAYRMLRHCNTWSEWVLGIGAPTYRQTLLGKIFGKMALRSNTKDDRPIGRNMPAGKAFLATEREGDVAAEQTKWLQHIDGFRHFANERFKHDFFGKMSKEQIGIFVYKHFDHHLRQFGV